MQVLEPTQVEQSPQRAEDNHAHAAMVEFAHKIVELSEGSRPALVPGELLLGTVLDPRLRVVAPIRVRLFPEHDQVVAEAVELNEFGFGSDFSEAVRDLQRALAQLYFSLEQSSERLGTDLQNTWERLQDQLRKTEPPQPPTA